MKNSLLLIMFAFATVGFNACAADATVGFNACAADHFLKSVFDVNTVPKLFVSIGVFYVGSAVAALSSVYVAIQLINKRRSNNIDLVQCPSAFFGGYVGGFCGSYLGAYLGTCLGACLVLGYKHFGIANT